jgi:1D-myo-inositol 3-kinase
MSQRRILSVGHVTHDLYPSGVTPGGCAYYGARVYRALGASSHLTTAVGMDFRFDDKLVDLEPRVQRAGSTTVFRNVYTPGKLRLQRLDALASAIAPEACDRSGYDLVHLAPVLGEVDLEHWTEIKRGALTAISVQGWIKRPGGSFDRLHPEVEEPCPATARAVVQQRWRPDATVLRRIDVACLGHEDLVDQGDLLQRLVKHVPVVACTHNVAGVDVYVAGCRSRVGIFSTKEIDPTGAGDSFAAGFLYGMASGSSPLEAAQLGAAVASVMVEHEGANGVESLGLAWERRSEVPIIKG